LRLIDAKGPRTVQEQQAFHVEHFERDNSLILFVWQIRSIRTERFHL